MPRLNSRWRTKFISLLKANYDLSNFYLWTHVKHLFERVIGFSSINYTLIEVLKIVLWCQLFVKSTLRSTILRFYSDSNKLNPLNLSILISGGEENNCDILSSGERKGSSTSSNCILCKLSRTKFIGSVCYVVSLEKVMYCGDNPFHFSPSYVCG